MSGWQGELPEPLREVRVPRFLHPSAFSDLERCPLKVIGSNERGRDPANALLTAVPEALLGSLLHHVRSELFAGRWGGLQEGRAAARSAFDQLLRQLEARLRSDPERAGLLPLRDAVGRRRWQERTAGLFQWAMALDSNLASPEHPRAFERVTPEPTGSRVRARGSLEPGAERALWSESLRLWGRLDLIEEASDGVWEIVEFKSGRLFAQQSADDEGDEPDTPTLIDRHVDQVRLYALLVEESMPGVLLRLFVEGTERHAVSWTDRDRETLIERLEEVSARLPPDQVLAAESLAMPGAACLTCRIRHRCTSYQREAPKWWRDLPGWRAAPMDVWGVVSERGAEEGGVSLTLTDAAGRRVRVTGLEGEAARAPSLGAEVWLFDLQPSEAISQHGGRRQPRNFHQVPPGPRWSRAWTLRFFMGRRWRGPYLTSLSVANLKLLDVREPLTFRGSQGQPRMWTVIIGENGTCKTTLLQAIALAAVGAKTADELSGNVRFALRDRRQGPDLGSLEIAATFEFLHGGPRARTFPCYETTLPGIGSVEVRSSLAMSPTGASFRGGSEYTDRGHPSRGPGDPLFEARDGKLPGWFVVGYGVFRQLPSSLAEPEVGSNPSVARLSSLFRVGRGLVATRFEGMEGTKGQRFRKVLNLVLRQLQPLLPRIVRAEFVDHGEPDELPEERHRFVQAVGAVELELPSTWLSHGYQSTIAWVADLIGRFVAETADDLLPADMDGLVLIDELDLFIHPTLQVQVVRALKRTFPRLQFVATTHSPLVLAGLRPDEDEVVRLVTNEAGGVVVRDMRDGRPHEPDARLMTATEIVRSYFGLEQLYPGRLGRLLREHRYLAADPYRSEEDEARLDELEVALLEEGASPDFPREPRTRLVE